MGEELKVVKWPTTEDEMDELLKLLETEGRIIVKAEDGRQAVWLHPDLYNTFVNRLEELEDAVDAAEARLESEEPEDAEQYFARREKDDEHPHPGCH